MADSDHLVLDIESLDSDGQGIAHHQGKVVFVEGALAGETVRVRIVRRKPTFDKARVEAVLRPSSQRVQPPCPHFDVCGGCALQHLDVAAQVAVKQRTLEDALAHIGKVRALQILPAIHGPSAGYRHRARLSVRLVVKKGGVLVGFHEKASSYVADMQQCLILPPHVSALLVPLRSLIGGLSRPDRMPQIEVAVGDRATVLCLRHLEALTDDDRSQLRAFGARHGVDWWLQPRGPETAHPLDPARADVLAYALPAWGLRMGFRPTDFTQVNPYINQVLVTRALALLEARADDRVMDLFCGLGNFSLPLATTAQSVLGVEGSATLVARARDAAAQHGLQGKARFGAQNLFEVDAAWFRAQGHFDRLLVDPPREGALAVARALCELEPAERPQRIVYVSCNPATLARDAGILHHVGGWVLRAAGIINMFPHTAHVESVAVFDRS
ncbi:23S rRNA (uracil(1939)-C(5))-methyltransferase RlmD [Castellaniella sp.]